MKKLVLGFVLLSACSFDAGEPPSSGTPWDLEDAGNTETNNNIGENSATNSATNNASPNNTTLNNTTQNNTSTNNTSTNNTSTNNTSTNNTNTNNTTTTNNQTNNTTPDMDIEPQPDGPCATNADCGGAQTCCPQLGADPVCRDTCIVGGLCGSAADCSNGDQCCDLSAIGIQDMFCAPTCGTSTGANSCNVTTDCPGTQVCCSGLNGATCSQRCFTGGVCEMDSDCKENKKCCDVPFGDKQCFDRCR